MPFYVALLVLLALLAVDAVIELGFISSTVGFLHHGAPAGTFTVRLTDSGSQEKQPSFYGLAGTPQHLLVNQGHTSNAAAGSALVLICLGGALSLFLRQRCHLLASSSPAGRPSWRRHPPRLLLYYTWLALQLPALLLTTISMIYVFVLANQHRGQAIDESVAARLASSPMQQSNYPLLAWTPQSWFAAVLQLDLAVPALRRDLARHLRTMRGWQYNLIVLFLLQLAETMVASFEFLQWRRTRGGGGSPWLLSLSSKAGPRTASCAV